MSKRALSSNVTPSKNKRFKAQHNQHQIDHFFASPKAKQPSTTSTSTPEFVQGSSRSKAATTAPKHPATPEVIDVDAFESLNSAPVAAPEPVSPVKKKSTPSQPLRVAKVSESAIGIDTYSALDVDPVVYDQSQPSGSSKAPYSLLTRALVSLSQTRSRIAIINTLTNVLRTIILKHPTSLLPAVYLLSNTLAPQFVSIELGLGASILSRSIQQISGLSPAALKKLYNTTGDPGDVAFAAKSNLRTLVPHPPLTVPYVYESMIRIANCKGPGAAKEKQKIVEKLLLAAIGEEVRYLMRTLCQNLRVGAVRTSILTALARAIVLTPPLGVSTDPSSGEIEHYASSDLLTKLKELDPSISSSKGKARDAEREELIGKFQRAESLVKQVYVKHPSYDQLIPALLEGGFDSLADRVPLTVGIPLLPMLGSPTRSLDEIYNRLGGLPFAAEFKYDGQRAQIHASRSPDGKDTIKIFSRHLEDMTSKYPDVIALVKEMFDETPKATSFVMDAEIVAIDPATGALKTFQELSNRARKDVNLQDVKILVCVFAFDLMHLNGEPLLGLTFRERRSHLRTHFTPRAKQPTDVLPIAHFNFVESCESEDGKTTIEGFLAKAVENRCEGLMIKLLDKAPVDLDAKQGRLKSLPSTYEPDIRTSAWLKLKKDYMDTIGDSLDVIPVGAWHGNGRKAQWWSPVLLALWNPTTGRPVALCKCMSGFSDVFYKSMRERYDPGSELCSKQPLWECDFGGYKPEIYFKPHEVWELKGADITESPISVAAQGLVPSSRGLSLRFPRFITTREDKGIDQSSTPSFLVDMWRSQQGRGGCGGNDDGELMDVDFEESEPEYESEVDDDT
ncbi:unnamed protein product [Cyclocybe aegerita]|uniref:DNA ligase n=1 Tax=Cyclocybe aegerita TaxID=1973307 RepID=A0A8S0XP63_CYCAE|nr:unnamed protein product [Cyclocybe aegerita]